MYSKELNKLHALLLTNSDDANIEDTRSLETFSTLLKTCNITTTLVTELPEQPELRTYDIVFVDLSKTSWCQDIPNEIQSTSNNARVVLFDAASDQYCEKQLLLAGIEGIFYEDDRPDIILKGLTQLQKNERWFKRETMNQALTELLDGSMNSEQKQPAKIHFPNLTRRENAIIRLVSSGAKNQEIADQLHISPNTVKTHLYSIFRKTDSRNRVELITLSQKMATSLN